MKWSSLLISKENLISGYIYFISAVVYGLCCWFFVQEPVDFAIATFLFLLIIGMTGVLFHFLFAKIRKNIPITTPEGQDALMELELKRAEIAALQSQINPHFLSNTLESIRGQALWDGKEEIAEMTETLSLFFRYGVGNKGNLVRLSEELRYVDLYFRILKYRFDERFCFSIINEEDDAGLLDCYVPKLMIQPLVENAVYHGLELRSGPGKVEIRLTCTEKSLLICIIDDGVGIDTENLIRINARLQEPQAAPVVAGSEENSTHSGIAIFNINARIKRYFGLDYGISIMSAQGVGTELEITLPRANSRMVLNENIR